MPMTVITLKKVPASLRGDLTKWMQEIATGVYVGNFSTRVRQYLWERICNSVGEGEATLSYASRNEIGYDFLTINADRSVVDSDGIPLVLVPLKEEPDEEENVLRNGFSTASHIHHARNSSFAKRKVSDHSLRQNKGYVVIDLETTGLHPERDKIIEIGAVKWDGITETFYNALVNIHETIPPVISGLTGITDDMLKEGLDIQSALQDLRDFIGNNILVGYNLSFDMDFLNTALHKCGMQGIGNDIIDVLKTVKREKLFQENYKLQTTLESYGISGTVPHRALEDAKLIFQLSSKLNVFYKFEN